MKPWHGGDSAPDDWDGGMVLHRRVGMDWPCTSNGGRWNHSDPARTIAHAHDIVAYTPTPSTSVQGAGEAWTGGDRVHSLVFADGQLLLSRDGTGELSFRESDLDCSSDGAVDYRIMKLPASEVIAIRDQLNKLFPPAKPETTRG